MERVRNGNGKRNPKCRSWYVIPLSTSLCLTHFLYRSLSTATDIQQQADPPRTDTDRCIGRYVYMHDLPTRFNTDMLRDCNTLSAWTDMCRFTSNSGLGPRLDASTYATDQFALDVIFHNRMKRYDCLTPDSRRASAVFVPFYAGLDVVRYLWGGYDVAARDSAAGDVVRWVRSRPEWDSMGGRDHFMVAGRTTWDFRRLTDDNSDWGSKLLLLPEVLNMTVLVLESSPWHNNDVGIPYPTYFHPAKYTDILSWQQRIRKLDRPWLFSFAGASRPNKTTSIRGVILDQCHASLKCKLLECDSKLSRCHSPTSVMELFESSVFCLQPQGDSYTRRSAFDAMIAGCVPVFFHPGSAYVQYVWHLPKNYTKYSVFIPEEEVREGKVSIEQVLSRFSEEEVKAMREEVVEMIPRLVYSDPRYSLESVKDAFDVAVEGVIRKVERIRREMRGEERIWMMQLKRR